MVYIFSNMFLIIFLDDWTYDFKFLYQSYITKFYSQSNLSKIYCVSSSNSNTKNGINLLYFKPEKRFVPANKYLIYICVSLGVLMVIGLIALLLKWYYNKQARSKHDQIQK